jgi:transcription initiation factor TFIID TATA-box-binding protein
METIQTHPSTAEQAKAFTAPGSFAFPNGHQTFGSPANGQANGQAPAANGNQTPNGSQTTNGGGAVTPATPAATPAANTGASGLTPTLQ